MAFASLGTTEAETNHTRGGTRQKAHQKELV